MVNSLDNYRREIDTLDAQIIEALGQRFEVCMRIAQFKKEQVIPMMQYGRVEEVRQRCRNLSMQHGVNPDLVAELYRLIIDESCRMETAIIDSMPEGAAEAA
jgi:4-amino-4-deoxychorismate mutase